MFALIIFNGDFDLPEYLLRDLAGGRPQRGDGGGGVEVKDTQKILMLKSFVGVDAAAFHQHVGDAYRSGLPKCHAYVKFIVILQKAIVNVVEDVAPVVHPVFVGHLRGDLLELFGKAVRAGNLIFAFQHGRDRSLMLLPQLPKERAAGIFPAARVRDVEHIS